MSTTADLNSKILDFAQVACEFGAAARQVAEEDLAACKEAQPLLDKAADGLVQAGLVKEDERDDAIKLGSTHAGALKLVGNLINFHGATKKAHETQMAQSRLGRGVGEDGGRQKKASVPSTESPFVGRRAGLGEKRASDEALLRGLGIGSK
jgi:hypothetical protein